ncbi:MAG: NAD(P)-dependent oxidoreductase [Myxococcota bacterium]
MSNTTPSKVAFIGLGAMGSRMAMRLLDAGYALSVYNRNPTRAQPLEERGAKRAETPAAAVAEADMVITMVTDVDASRQVWCAPETGVLAGLRPGTLALEASTLTPAWMAELSKQASEMGGRFMEAPVVGTRPHAEGGKLTWLLGGSSDDVEAVRPMLQVMGAAVHHVGPIGQGTAMKLAVNALFGIQVAALAEVLGLLTQSGLETEDAVAILNQMAITSPAAKVIGGAIAAKAFAPMFPIDLVHKDFGYVTQAADAVGASVPTSSAVQEVYQRAREAGMGGDNINGVAQLFGLS